ncbi:MAG TPA: hypothetical protein VFK10_05135 [Burkholderiaceae bacterium]|nr:hypothetical protein [Burkholderiaceae bacterium]
MRRLAGRAVPKSAAARSPRFVEPRRNRPQQRIDAFAARHFRRQDMPAIGADGCEQHPLRAALGGKLVDEVLFLVGIGNAAGGPVGGQPATRRWAG